MFKADSELNHYSELLRNEFFLQTGFYLASPFNGNVRETHRRFSLASKTSFLSSFVPCIASEQERNTG